MLVADPDDRGAGGERRGAARRGRAGRDDRRHWPTPQPPAGCSTRPTRAAAPCPPSAATSRPAPAGCAASSTASPATTSSGSRSVLPTGEVIRTGGRLWKDVAGYDITRLLTGSEGTLGVHHRGHRRAAADAGDLAHRRRVLRLARRRRPRRHARSSPAAPCRPRWSSSTARCINAVEDYAHLGLDRDAGALLLFGDDGPSATSPSPCAGWRGLHRPAARAASSWPPTSPSPSSCWPPGAARCRRWPDSRR